MLCPCSEYVAVIQRYVETRRAYEWGLVCQALAGAMRHVLQVRGSRGATGGGRGRARCCLRLQRGHDSCRGLCTKGLASHKRPQLLGLKPAAACEPFWL